jgi:hypothetical protein
MIVVPTMELLADREENSKDAVLSVDSIVDNVVLGEGVWVTNRP